jgi:hypothetical protein
MDNFTIGGVYAPAKRKTTIRKVFIENLERHLFSFKKKRNRRNLPMIVGGDFNARVAPEYGLAVGPHVPRGISENWDYTTKMCSKRFVRSLDTHGFTHVSSHFPVEERATHKKGGEIDGWLTPSRWRKSVLSYNSEWAPPFANGSMDHKITAITIAVWMKTGGKPRLPRKPRKLKETISAELTTALNTNVRECTSMLQIRDVLKNHMNHMWDDGEPEPPTIPQASEENAATVARTRNEVWDFLRDCGALKPKKNLLTAKQMAGQFHANGNQPSKPVPDSFFTTAEKWTDVEIDEFDRPIEVDEARQALKLLKSAGAADCDGIIMKAIKMMNDSALGNMLAIAEDDIRSGRFHSWETLHTVKCASLFKNKGDPGDPDNYRYLSVGHAIPKLFCKVLEKRLSTIIERKELLLDTQFGFRKNRSTIEALVLMSRVMEDAAFYGANSNSATPHGVFVDLKKAFPSLNWEIVTGLARVSGLEGKPMWNFLERSQRLANYTFKKGKETEIVKTANGVKEGCVSSPTLFLWAYCSVVREYRKQRQGTDTKGLKLASRADRIPDRDRAIHVAKLLWPSVGEDESCIDWLSEIMFADDTVLLDQVLDGQETSIMASQGLPGLKLYRELITEVGITENPDKTKGGKIIQDSFQGGEGAPVPGATKMQSLPIKNLGVYVDKEVDNTYRTQKAQKQFYALKTKLGGVGHLTQKHRAELIMACSRSILTYGLTARGVTPGEYREFQQLEDRWLQDLLSWPRHKMKNLHVNMQKLRYDTRITTVENVVKFQKATFFGHTMRKKSDDIVKKSLLGRFIPELAPGAEACEALRDDRQRITRLRDAVLESSIMGELVGWLTKVAKIPRGKIITLAEDNSAAGKNRWYKLTREAFVRTILQDYEKANGVTPEQLEEVKKELMRKYGVQSLTSWEEIGDDVVEEPNPPLSATAKQMVANMKNKCAVEKKSAEELLLAQYADKLQVRGKLIRCLECELDFSSSPAAMVRHIETHKEGLPTKICRTATNKNRPMEHLWNPAIPGYYGGSDAPLHHFLGVEEHLVTVRNKKFLFCKKCKERITPYDETLPPGARGKSLSRLRRHVLSCDGGNGVA